MVFDILLELLGCMLAGKRVWIVTVREEQHFNVHTFLQQHVRSTHGGMDTSFVTVIEQYYILSESAQQLDLENGKGRTRVGYDILQTTLVHGNNVGVAFDHIDAVFLGDGFLCLINAIQFAFLVVDFRIGRVDVLLLHTFGGCIELTTSKGHHLTADIQPGEHGTSCKTVINAMLVDNT